MTENKKPLTTGGIIIDGKEYGLGELIEQPKMILDRSKDYVPKDKRKKILLCYKQINT